MARSFAAEFFGTFWLVLGGCGAAVLAGETGEAGQWARIVGISLAFGLTVVTMAYAIGHVSGAHLNPAVTLGLWASGRFPAKSVGPYVLAQVLGGLVGAAVLLFLARQAPGGYDPSVKGLAANGYGEHSPVGYPMVAALVAEALLTFGFLFVILGATSAKAHPQLAGLAIGLCLTLIHLIGIPITRTSVNPARSTGPAVFVGGWALAQLWLFWVAPILGAIVAGFIQRSFDHEPESD